MRKLLLITLSLVFALSASLALAASKNSPLTMVDVLQRLDQAGYHQVHQIQYKHGIYKVEAYNAQNQKVQFRVDAQNGAIPPLKESSKQRLKMLQAAQKAKTAGYVRIQKIEFDDGRYEIQAYDTKGGKVKLHFDPATGKISKKRFDD